MKAPCYLACHLLVLSNISMPICCHDYLLSFYLPVAVMSLHAIILPACLSAGRHAPARLSVCLSTVIFPPAYLDGVVQLVPPHGEVDSLGPHKGHVCVLSEFVHHVVEDVFGLVSVVLTHCLLPAGVVV